jgi:hypothetical protein
MMILIAVLAIYFALNQFLPYPIGRAKRTDMRFENPVNGYVAEVSSPGLWSFLFGPLYFAINGVWTHAVASLFIAPVTLGLSWLNYPFFASGIMRGHYLGMGWTEMRPSPPGETNKFEKDGRVAERESVNSGDMKKMSVLRGSNQDRSQEVPILWKRPIREE